VQKVEAKGGKYQENEENQENKEKVAIFNGPIG